MTLFQELEQVSGRLAKEDILQKHIIEGKTEIFGLLQYCLNPLVTFGVKKVIDPDPGAFSKSQRFTNQEFMVLCDRLAARELTGNKALNEIFRCALECTEDNWYGTYRRLLLKDLRCGVDTATINRVLKKNNMEQFMIPVFSCQLAADTKGGEIGLTGVKQIESKLDGVRVLTVIKKNGDVKMYSRSGRELTNFGHVIDEIKSGKNEFPEDFVIDGEMMSNSFQDLMSQVHRKYDVNAGDSIYNVFDCLSLKGFLNGVEAVPQRDRTKRIQEWVSANNFRTLVSLRQETIDLDTPEGLERLDRINKKALAGGYEGIMLKDPDAFYECKRSKSWLKMKPYIEVTLAVVDIEPGTGKYINTLGAMICEGSEEGKEIRVNVGSGLSDKLRDEIWASGRGGVIRQLVEVRADAITKNKDGGYSLRFPRFKCFRGFLPGEKL